jgi:hypothetical protein
MDLMDSMDGMDSEGEALHLIRRFVSSSPFPYRLSRFGRSPKRLEGEALHLVRAAGSSPLSFLLSPFSLGAPPEASHVTR